MSAHTPKICRECKLPIPPACASMLCSCRFPHLPEENTLSLDSFKWDEEGEK